ncbi:MAG TPA: ABC transporter permease [Symbiobacteriaceae bacterium]|nr:ABC transporter permease [Symbiobacteriaceae bacterium]
MNGTTAGGRFLKAYVFLAYAFLYLPIAVLIVFSFNTSRANVTWQGFTLRWYGDLLQNRAVAEAAWNSLQIAAVSTVVSTVLGTMAAFAVHRLRFRGRRLLEGGLYIPIVLPEIIMGISLLSLFAAAGVELGFGTIIISHITFSIPFVFVVVRARLHDMSTLFERAAMDLGADEWLTFWRVTLPLVSPGILAGALLAFTLSIDDLIITFFVGEGVTTLPLLIDRQIRVGVGPEMNALSTVFLLVTLLMITTSEWLRRRSSQ